MTNNEAEDAEELLDELATAKPGEVLILDEVGNIPTRRRKQFKSQFERLTPEVVNKRIWNIRRRGGGLRE